ncbi:hypothetical protein SSX86_028183 [Deinandra increscens subsp. villosa]|uniref:F-box domain-containing protein n=1 Tax=Deinandra increscens subsp. villosa TaxID=3103831 RepID=A0AAP0GJE0_9ASTR
MTKFSVTCIHGNLLKRVTIARLGNSVHCRCAFTIAGMAMTRGMTAKLNRNASSGKRPKTFEDNGGSSWTHMLSDILFLIILRLGVVDFIAFSGVCKSWRTVALSNKNKFMLSRLPMSMLISAQVAKKKECYLGDCEGRTFKTILPRSCGRTFFGVVSGYLIFLGWKNHDFRLVNPITRHEIHFPSFPFHGVLDPEKFRCILVFSSTMSTWVFVVSFKFSNEVSFSFSSEGANWTHISSDNPVCDVHFFQGKIYALSQGMHLHEVKLNPTPTLTLLKMKNLVMSKFKFLEFSTFDEKLYVVDYRSNYLRGTCEIDLDQMRWMDPTEVLEEYAGLDQIIWTECLCFASLFKPRLTKLELWENPREQYKRFGSFRGADQNKNKRSRSTPYMSYLYLPHECLDVNLLHE